ncbi:MAG TPA: carboxypeptidase-like regulatory domain-containing protein [Pyrinomonadaceae bacterium]|nr:carboxypeptidase-like regulatory domain-containing protein [Pyrinomonadaceae bacterium]
MSKKKSFIDSVEVKRPCTEDWEKMDGNNRVRFCSHCSKPVNNLSEMTRKRAMRMVRASGGSLCIRYIQHPATRRPVFADQLFQITRRAPGLAAGVMTASVALSTQIFAQGGASHPGSSVSKIAEESIDKKTVRPASETTETSKRGRLSGTITDPNGAVIPGAKVTIFSVDAAKTASTMSNDEGLYKFDALEPGDYRAEFEGPPGFAKQIIHGIKISRGIDQVSDTALDIGSFTLTIDVPLNLSEEVVFLSGVVASVEYSTPLAKPLLMMTSSSLAN